MMSGNTSVSRAVPVGSAGQLGHAGPGGAMSAFADIGRHPGRRQLPDVLKPLTLWSERGRFIEIDRNAEFIPDAVSYRARENLLKAGGELAGSRKPRQGYRYQR